MVALRGALAAPPQIPDRFRQNPDLIRNRPGERLSSQGRGRAKKRAFFPTAS